MAVSKSRVQLMTALVQKEMVEDGLTLRSDPERIQGARTRSAILGGSDPFTAQELDRLFARAALACDNKS